MSTVSIDIRRARLEDAAGIAAVHDQAWRNAYRGILPGLDLNARVVEPVSGRVLEVYSDQPGVQFYSGNFLDGTLKGRGGVAIPKRGAVCLETQHFPDSPNQPKFPSTLVKAGKEYHSVTTWQFTAR